MKIVIDMQGIQTNFSSGRGVGRYTRELIKEFIKLNNANNVHDIYLALNGAFPETIKSIRNYYSGIISQRKIIIWQNSIPTAYMGSNNVKQIKLAEVCREIFFWSLQAELIFSTNLQENIFENAVTSVRALDYGAKYVTTLHDVVPYYYPQYKNEWYADKIQAAIKSDLILTVSESSKSDIAHFLSVDDNKIKVVNNAVELESLFGDVDYDDKYVLSKYNIENKFIFYVGGVEEHKNIINLLKAFVIDSNIYNNYQLVIAGAGAGEDASIGAHISQLNVNLRSRINFPGRISDKDLGRLYKLCACFVFPSTHEGFGLPVLEAMACGAVVIGSNQSSVGELIGNPIATFDPYDPLNMSVLIKKAVANIDFRNDLLAKSRERIKNYSWKKSAMALTNIFSEINEVTLEPFTISSLLKKLGQISIDDVSDEIIEAFAHDVSNSVLKKNQTVYIDISAVICKDDKSGIQRVVRAISKNISDGCSGDVYLVYSSVDDLEFKYAYEYMKNSVGIDEKYLKDGVVEFKNNDILLYLDLHPANAIAHDFFNEYLISKGVFIYHVVYDIIPILRENTFWPELVTEFKLWLKVISKSSGAICISKSVASELEEYLVRESLLIPSYEIHHFHLGADIKNSIPTIGGIDSNAKNLLEKLKASTSFLMVGTLEPRKGHKLVLESFERLWHGGLDITLVIVGRLGWGMDDFELKLLQHEEYEKKLFWLNSISDDYLLNVYSSCSCLILASEAEGFGLPLIEAAQNNLPIIARDISVFREVASEHAFYFDALADAKILSDTILTWLELFYANKHPRSTNMPWFTWAESSDLLLKILRQ